MKTRFKFYKYEGTGNDIIIFDFPPQNLSRSPDRLAKIISRICDRNFGIGADEVTFVEKAERNKYRATFYNSDGSRAEVCGNGLRCMAKHIFETKRRNRTRIIPIVTDAGLKECKIINHSRKKTIISVEMGSAEDFFHSYIRIRHRVGSKTLILNKISVGNPHCVIFGRFSRREMKKIGKDLQSNKNFPEGTNVEFVRSHRTTCKRKNIVELTVYERGCGFTLACGSGSVATYIAMLKRSLITRGHTVIVKVPGGTLEVKTTREGKIILTGSAVFVFYGYLNPDIIK